MHLSDPPPPPRPHNYHALCPLRAGDATGYPEVLRVGVPHAGTPLSRTVRGTGASITATIDTTKTMGVAAVARGGGVRTPGSEEGGTGGRLELAPWFCVAAVGVVVPSGVRCRLWGSGLRFYASRFVGVSCSPDLPFFWSGCGRRYGG